MADERLALAYGRGSPCCELALQLFAIMPISNQLKAVNSASPGPKSRMLIERWGKLHAARSALGFAAVLIFLWYPCAESNGRLWAQSRRSAQPRPLARHACLVI